MCQRLNGLHQLSVGLYQLSVGLYQLSVGLYQRLNGLLSDSKPGVEMSSSRSSHPVYTPFCMNSSTSRVVFAILWIATVAGAYVVGRKGSAPNLTRGANGAATMANGKASDGLSSAPEAGRISSAESQAARPPVKDIILQARAAMGNGM